MIIVTKKKEKQKKNSETFSCKFMLYRKYRYQMVGYQIVQLDTYDNTETYYTIVKDPGTSGVPEKTVLWSVSNIYGYFILYLH